jgi:hypothetical protein
MPDGRPGIVVDLPALSPGRIDYMCSMGMYGGTIEVVEKPTGRRGSAGG